MTHPFPLPNMTIHPDSCGGCEPALDWPGFRGCVHWAATNPEIVKAFREETGADLLAFVSVQNSDTAKQAAMARFADWVAVNVWGVEETP